MNINFEKEWNIVMEVYKESYLNSLKINPLDVSLLSKIGLPKLESYVQDCFIPLNKFYTLKFEKNSYFVFAQCSDLFPERAFLGYHKEKHDVYFFSKNKNDKIEKKVVNSSLSNFLKSRRAYQEFKFKSRSLYKEVILKNDKSTNDIFFTKSMILLFKKLIEKLHEIEEQSFQSYYQYWPEILMDIPMNYSVHFQHINEDFEILKTNNL